MDFSAFDPVVQFSLIFLLLIGVWSVLRVVLRLARRVFACGCALLLMGGVLVFLLSMAEILPR